jgi:Schlafen group 3, DNA/RNA helicase domain
VRLYSVIFGKDLVFDGGWRGNREISQDSVVKKAAEEEFVNLVKQTYRVLLTRGMKGCFIFFAKKAEVFEARHPSVRALFAVKDYCKGLISTSPDHPR